MFSIMGIGRLQLQGQLGQKFKWTLKTLPGCVGYDRTGRQVRRQVLRRRQVQRRSEMSQHLQKMHLPLRQGRLRVRFEVTGFDTNWESLKGTHHVGNTLWGVVTALLDWHERLTAELAKKPQNTPVDEPLQGLFVEAWVDE
jgi:hypothetical protein